MKYISFSTDINLGLSLKMISWFQRVIMATRSIAAIMILKSVFLTSSLVWYWERI